MNAFVSYSIRPATEDDIALVVQVEQASNRHPWNEAQFIEEMTKPYARFWVITDDETDAIVVGFIVFWVLLDECQIHELAIAPEFRRQGHALHLVREAVREGLRLNAKRAVLEVRKSNEAAIALYQQAQFSITQVRKHFYSDGEDAYQMAVSLDNDSVPFE